MCATMTHEFGFILLTNMSVEQVEREFERLGRPDIAKMVRKAVILTRDEAARVHPDFVYASVEDWLRRNG